MKWKTIVSLFLVILILVVLARWEDFHVESEKQENMASKLVFGVQKNLPKK